MNLSEAMLFTEGKVADGFKSDGCTFAPDLGIEKFCVMHDCLIEFSPVSRKEADELFYEGILTKGKRYYPVAVLYFPLVRLQAKIGVAGILMLAVFMTMALAIGSQYT